ERTYDALHRLLSIHYPSDASEDVHYAYDQPASQSGCAGSYAIGHLSRMTDPSGNTTYCYDARGKVVAEQRNISGITYALAYAWTPAERLASLTYPSGVTVAYQRDADGQATTITEQGPHDAAPVTVVSHVARLPFGPASRIAFGADGKLAQTRTYDTNYRGTAVQGLGLNLRVQRDAIGNIVALRTHRHQYQPDERYGYDTLQRLTDVTGPWGFLEQHYAYNTTGDRTSKATPDDGLVRYDYQPGSHRLAAINRGLGWSWGGWNPFCRWNQHYCQRSGEVLTDANGNITQMPHDGATLSLAYGANNRLTQVATSHGESATYLYNGLGQRVESVTMNPDQSRDFIYDGTQLLAERTAGSDDARAYIWLGHTLIASLDTTPSATTVHYVATDFLGTPRRVTTTSGNTVWSWHYAGNPFGETPPQGSYAFNLRFPGQYHDALTGTNYNIHRDYSPAQGRYVESDPLGLAAGMDTYVYVGNDPLVRVDPQGRLWITAIIGAVSGGIAGYEAGGWQGAIAGGAVGGVVGFFAPQLSAAAGTAVGGGVAGMFAATGTTVGLGALAGGGATVLGNGIHNMASPCKKEWDDGLGFGMTLGGMAPLMSGEAFAAGAGEAVIGETTSNVFSGITGVFGVAGEALDPGASHGLMPAGSENNCACQK
ncbi:MAG TPA: RHS repeat-associated core domain-containing protein, partial [Rhodanobacteraceae bacterium]